MDLIREKNRARGNHRAMGGGDSSSASTQNTDYNYSDSRSVTSVDSRQDNRVSQWTDASTDVRQDNRQYSNTDSRQDNRSVDWGTQSGNTSTSTTAITNVTATDFGSVAAGQAVSIESLKQNSTNTAALFGLADKLFAGTQKNLDANAKLAATLSASANEAYEGAADQATGNKTTMLVAMGVVGVVAVMAFYKK